MLFIQGKACGIIEAKREGASLGKVAEQLARYAVSTTKHIKRWAEEGDPLPFLYEATNHVEAIAVVHVEFILVHPFRERNGRISRLLANVMALQAGKPELDFTAWDADRENYFLSIHAGMACDYEPIKWFVRQALRGGDSPA